MNSTWILLETSLDWQLSTSNSSWTSDSHGYKWLTTVFELNTRPIDFMQWRLLIMNGHSSHMTANFIAFCMEHLIDLLILPPYTLHLLQLLDVGVFSPLKYTLADEIDTIARFDSSCISHADWVSMFVWVRSRVLITSNIFAGWKSANLEPF